MCELTAIVRSWRTVQKVCADLFRVTIVKGSLLQRKRFDSSVPCQVRVICRADCLHENMVADGEKQQFVQDGAGSRSREDGPRAPFEPPMPAGCTDSAWRSPVPSAKIRADYGVILLVKRKMWKSLFVNAEEIQTDDRVYRRYRAAMILLLAGISHHICVALPYKNKVA